MVESYFRTVTPVSTRSGIGRTGEVPQDNAVGGLARV